MKLFVFFVFSLVSHLTAQTQSKDWIDLSNKSDADIIRILEKEIATLAESPAAEASERVRLLQMQEKDARQSFDQKTLLLEGDLGTAAAAMEAAEKAIADLQTDSTTLSAQIDLYDRSRQRLRERIDKFPFKAVVLAKATYTGSLEPVKEKMIYEAGRLAIQEVNGVYLISETLVKNGILVSDIIQGTTEGRADCQPREWKTLENGTQRVIYLYGLCDIYPLAESVKLSSQAAQLPLLVETLFIKSANDSSLAKLQANIQEEIRTMFGAAEQANIEVRNNLNTLVQQENQLLRSSGVTEEKGLLQNRFDAVKRRMDASRLNLFAKHQAYEASRKKFWYHLNSQQRIEIVTQSDLERNRSQDVIKAKLVSDCLTQFRTTVKSLYSQEKATVEQSQLVSSLTVKMFEQVRLKAAKILGVYLSSSEGDIKYTASVAFRFGFDYVMPTTITPGVTSTVKRKVPLRQLRSKETSLSEQDVKAMLAQQGFYDTRWNKNGKGLAHHYEAQMIEGFWVVVDHTTGLVWQQIGSTDYMGFAAAEEYIRKLNAEEFAGFNDWRLPTLEEAMSLMEPKSVGGDLHIDPVFFREQERMWTADKSSAAEAWVVTYRYGVCGSSPLDGRYYVRSVR